MPMLLAPIGSAILDKTFAFNKKPKNFDWNLFVGPSKSIDYKPSYTPYLWRNFWQFSNGTIGTLGTHFLEPAFRALKLSYPTEIKASSDELNLETISKTNKITFWFEERDNLPKVAMPALQMNWFDGGILPEVQASLNHLDVLNPNQGGIIFYGTEGMIVADKYGENPKVIKNNTVVEPNIIPKIHRIENPFLGGHEQDFIRACKESNENKLETTANLDSQDALNETVLLGSLAIKLQSLNKNFRMESRSNAFYQH